MKNEQIYIVTNVDKFKDFCEEKLGSNITAEDYIEMESFKNEKVHIVPNIIPEGFFIKGLPQYNIYISTQSGSDIKNIIELSDDDIERLVFIGGIQDLEEYSKWKTTLGFKVTDVEAFCKRLFKTLTLEETVATVNVMNRRKAKYIYDFYIIRDENKSNIYINNPLRNIAYKIPYTTLSNDDLSYFIQHKIVENKECKIRAINIINFDGRVSAIAPDYAFLRCVRVIPRNDVYYAKALLKGEDFYDNKIIRAVGSTEQESKEKLLEKVKKMLSHEDFSVTYDIYKSLINDSKEKDL